MKETLTVLSSLLLIVSLAACGSARLDRPSEESSASAKLADQLQAPQEIQMPEIGGSGAPAQVSSEVPQPPMESVGPSQAAHEAVSEATQVGEPSLAPDPAGDGTVATEMKLHITLDGAEYSAVLLDNSASRDLYSRLPLSLEFEDYNSLEKIAYLTDPLDTANASSSCDPSIGTLAYYAPWGNLSVFYQDFRQSDGLVPLGKLVSGIETFAMQDGNFTVTIEKED